jgi:multidrug transporter EmrE-like cation transporter
MRPGLSNQNAGALVGIAAVAMMYVGPEYTDHSTAYAIMLGLAALALLGVGWYQSRGHQRDKP